MKTLMFLFCVTILVALSSKTNGQTLKDDLKKAQTLYQEGKTEEATQIYLGLMEKYPKSREAVQGWLIVNMKRIPTGELEAIKQLEELELKYPDNTGILFFKTFIQAEYNQTDEALKNTEKLITVEPEDGLNWLFRGQVLEAAGRNDEALAPYQKSTELAPDNADSWQNLAGLYAKTGRFDEAIPCFSKAIELAPNQPVFIYNRGCCYCLKGDRINALADLLKAVTMNPQLKTHAQTDTDFKSLWEDADFKKIVGN
jgi:Flp pilus assembly protein TadD